MISFHPIVGPSMYRSIYPTQSITSVIYCAYLHCRLIVEPVYDKYNSWVGGGLFLIQLKVNKGDQYSLYEDGEHEVLKLITFSLYVVNCFMLKVYVRSGDSPKGPLTAREIKERVTAEYEQVSTI